MNPEDPTGLTNDLESLLNPVITLARSAGDEILAVYDSDFAVQHKDDDSP